MKTSHYWALAALAWAGFIVSFFLPAFDQMPGWKAAVLQGIFWPQAIQGNSLSIHYLLLGFANLLMLLSPFFIARGAQDGRFIKWLRGLSLASVLLVWLFVGRLLGAQLRHGQGLLSGDVRVGCYLWAISFILICLASLLQPIPLKAQPRQAV
ncbi:MAG: hypothetical protein ACRED1_01170 [Limisphaerales bacterium]